LEGLLEADDDEEEEEEIILGGIQQLIVLDFDAIHYL